MAASACGISASSYEIESDCLGFLSPFVPPPVRAELVDAGALRPDLVGRVSPQGRNPTPPWEAALMSGYAALTRPTRLGFLSSITSPTRSGWACGLIWLHAWAEGGSRGVRPAAQSLSFASPPGGRPKESHQRKSPKKGRPQVCDPCAALRGKPASWRLRGALRNSLRCVAAPFKQPQRVR